MPEFEDLLNEDDPAFKLVPDPDAQGGLGNLGAAVVEMDTAFFSSEALHARSPVEQGITWVDSPDKVPGGSRYWIAWITLGRNDQREKCFKGVTTCEMLVDRDAMVGYKPMGEHVNAMRGALEGQVDIKLPDSARAALRRLLTWEKELWTHTDPETRAALDD